MFIWKLYYLTSSRIPGEKAHTIQILKMFDELKSQACDLELIIPNRKNTFKIFTDLKKYYSLKNELTIKKIFCISLFHLFKNPKLQWLFFNIMTWTFTKYALKYIKSDNISKQKIICTREEGIVRALQKLNSPFKIIFEIHQLPRTKNIEQQKILYKKCWLIITVSDYLKKILVDMGVDSKKIKVLHSGHDNNIFKPSKKIKKIKDTLNIPSNSKIVMYAGSLATRKLTNFLIKSASYLDKNIYYVIIGGSTKEITEICKKEKPEENVKFVERVPYSEVPHYLGAADLLIQYSPPSPNPNELGSFSPVKLFEYMGMGKPILAPNLPWIREIISDQNTGMLFDPYSPKDLANKIEQLIFNTSKCILLGQNAMQNVNNYSFKARSKKLIQAIESHIL